MTPQARQLSMDISETISRLLLTTAETAAKAPSVYVMNRRQLLHLYLRHFQAALEHELNHMEVPS